VEAVRSLLLENPSLDINWKNEIWGGRTALHTACCNGHDAVVSLLIAHPKIDLNQLDNYGFTPFIYACACGNISCVRVLLSDGRTDINPAAKSRCTPLWLVSFSGHLDVIKWIIASGRAVDLAEGTVSQGVHPPRGRQGEGQGGRRRPARALPGRPRRHPRSPQARGGLARLRVRRPLRPRGLPLRRPAADPAGPRGGHGSQVPRHGLPPSPGPAGRPLPPRFPLG
jgi:hypothetical protein